jgi:chemotaxis protein histidine kinase CheA
VEVTGQEQRFRAMFAEEAEGRLATLSELLLELERNGDDRELLSSVFREAHTLKGAAAVVGLADVLRVAHALEEVLEGLRRGDRAAAPGLVDALLGAVDGMREMVPAVLAGNDRGDHADRLVAALRSPATPPPDPAPPPPPSPGAPEPRPPVPGPPNREGSPNPEPAAPAVHTPHPASTPAARPRRRETIRLPVERLDELVRLVGEASAAARRVGRLVTDQLGVDPAGVPSCTS